MAILTNLTPNLPRAARVSGLPLTPGQRTPRRWIPCLCVGIVLTCPIGEGQAQELNPVANHDPTELSLEELTNIHVDSVFGASKYEQKVTRAPASVNIVTSDDIKKLGYRTLADVLRSTPGLYVSDDRNYSFLGFRGFSQPGDFNTGILLLIDGHRVNDAIYNLMYVANEAVIDVDMIDRVEIIRGPSSSIYGNSAFFGVVNVITKRGGQIDGVEVSTEVASFDTYDARLSVGKHISDDLELILSGAYLSSAGQHTLFYPEYDTPQNHDGVAVNSDEERAVHLFGRLSYRDFTLSTAYSARHKDIPTAPADTAFNSGKGHSRDARGYLDLKYQHVFEHPWTIMGRISYDWYPYDAVYPRTNAAPPPTLLLNQDRSLGQWARAELQTTWNLADRHTVIFGAEYQENLREYQTNFDETPRTSYLNIDHTSHSYAFYAQGDFALGKAVSLNAGLRVDHFDVIGSSVSPRCGVIFSPTDTSTFKVLYGQAFRAPNDYELNFASTTVQGNPDLEPETIRTYELVYEKYFPGSLRFSAAGYHYNISGLIVQTTQSVAGFYVFKNLDRVHSNGLEIQLEGHFVRWLHARASYALQRTEDANTEVELSNSPRHLAKISMSVPFYRDTLFSSLELQYSSRVITPSRGSVGAFALVNITLFSQKLANNMEMSVSIYNLFDSRYSVPSSGSTLQDAIQQNGRSVRGKVTYRF